MSTQRILILSFYYEPDLSAGSFRTSAVVTALLEQDPAAFVDVVTTSPNRYGTFASSAPAEEHRERVRIRRVPLPTHKGGMRDQSRAFIHFFLAAQHLTAGEQYSVVYATSSRLMTAALGALLAQRLGAPLYLDIRDIFVDTMEDVLEGNVARLLMPMLRAVERWAIGSAAHVNLVSPGFADYFGKRYPHQAFSYFTNGIDEEFLATGVTASSGRAHARVRVLYAGNVGEGQGLHSILPGVARHLSARVDFVVIGDGGRRRQLEQALAAADITNVMLRAPMARLDLIAEYRQADVLFLHLNDYEAFRKVLPSKIFEYAALGKPIWAGVAGYAARFLEDEVRNAAMFVPCDVDGAVAAFSRLTIRDTPRPEFIDKYRRQRIMRAMATDILRVAHSA